MEPASVNRRMAPRLIGLPSGSLRLGWHMLSPSATGVACTGRGSTPRASRSPLVSRTAALTIRFPGRLLERDPVFELRLLSAGDVAPTKLPPNAAPPGQELAAAARRLPASGTVASQAATAGLDGVRSDAVDAGLANAATADVLRQDLALGGTLRAALARAFVADALLRADEQLVGSFPLDGAYRD